MKKKKITTACFVVLTFVVVFSIARAENIDSKAISQVSKEIAEWKLMNEGKNETQTEQIVYVSSSLSGMVEKGVGKEITGVQGLAAFDNNDYWIRSEIKNWELNTGIEASKRYISRLPTNPWPDIQTSAGSELTIRGMGSIYGSIGRTYNDIANIFRAQQGLGPSNVVLQNTARGLQIYQSSTTIMGAGLQAADTFQKTVHYVGTSMQVMNPPIYLQNNPKFTPSQKILGMPISGTWGGAGSYRIPGGVVNYQETLKTSGPGPITQTHTDVVTTNMGTYYRHVEIKTPASSGIERFVLTHYPVGSYWDTNSSVSYTTTRSHQSYRIETVGGISKVTPLPSSGFGKSYGGVGSNWNSPPPTFNATWKTAEMGSTTYKYPSIDWTSIPNTNWTIPSANPLPTYTPSIPKMPTSTPTMPSSSWGRKY